MAGTKSVRFSCTCGRVCGRIDPASPRTGTHLKCHCRDCRAAERFFQQPDPGLDGVDLFQTSPDTIHVDKGQDQLAVLRLGPKGPMRWYAACCNAPLFNTLERPGLPFATALVARVEDPTALGPVVAHASFPKPGGGTYHKNGGRMVWNVMTRMLAARLSGRWRKTPFFDSETGKPNGPVRVLSREERAVLYD